MELKVDPERIGRFPETGIYVRACAGDKWGTFDISELTKDSLLTWLKSRLGDNPLAENTLGIVLGHGRLHDEYEGPVVFEP